MDEEDRLYSPEQLRYVRVYRRIGPYLVEALAHALPLDEKKIQKGVVRFGEKEYLLWREKKQHKNGGEGTLFAIILDEKHQAFQFSFDDKFSNSYGSYFFISRKSLTTRGWVTLVAGSYACFPRFTEDALRTGNKQEELSQEIIQFILQGLSESNIPAVLLGENSLSVAEQGEALIKLDRAIAHLHEFSHQPAMSILEEIRKTLHHRIA